MRWTLALAGLCSCAGPDTMAWPYAATPTPAPVPAPTPVVAQGGAVEVEAPVPEPAGDFQLSPEFPNYGRKVLTLSWPLPATGVNSLFGERTDPIDSSVRYHAGVDLESEYGAVIETAADGYVSQADWHAGHGRRVVIDHAGGFSTVYSHLSQILVVSGTWVRSGQSIGRVGNSGRSTGPHLHFEIRRWGNALDPLDYLGVAVPLE